MVPNLFNKGMIATVQPALFFSSERHRAIVNNIANVSTPGYKVVDVPVAEFQEAFRRSLEARDDRPVPVFQFLGSAHIAPRADGNGLAADFVETPGEGGILRHDGNNVMIEQEMAKLSRNASYHNALVELLNQQFGLVQSAIRERMR